MVALGALAGLWLLQRELRRTHLPDRALDAGLAGLVGGMAGAKLLWVAEHLGEEPLGALLLSRGGMSWFGGFAGGLALGLFWMRWQRLPIVPVLAAAAPALALGHALGRIGCFLVGDDYGTPSTLPWAVAFPEGLPPTTVPVHPTQIYEAVPLFGLTWLLMRWRREGRPDGFVLGTYLVLTGALRFAIEFLRVNERVFAGLSVAHLAAVAAMVTGALVLRSSRRSVAEVRP